MDVVRKNLVEVFALKIRVKFEKTGVVRFIGHLDIFKRQCEDVQCPSNIVKDFHLIRL